MYAVVTESSYTEVQTENQAMSILSELKTGRVYVVDCNGDDLLIADKLKS